MASLLRIGTRVEVTGKGVQGEVAFIGTTGFSTGKWIGLILDEPKGKNNGTVQNKEYFKCNENHGMFVRQTQLTILTEMGSRIDLANTSSSATSPGQMVSPDEQIRATPKSRLTSIRRKSSPASHVPPSRASSRTSLSGRSKESRSREDMSSSTSSIASSSDLSTKKTSSFVETGFVETLKPQFTPGLVVSSPAPTPTPPHGTPTPTPAPTRLNIGGLPGPQDHSHEIELLKEQLKDYQEKLDTMRIRYKEKSHELESTNLQLEQASEFKAKIMEAQAALKKDLERLKREKQEAIEAKEEMADIADTLEMATLDKEMAEEKAESLQKDLEQAQERIEELEMEIEILKSELSDKSEGIATTVEGADGEQVPFKMKQIIQQNDKLKDTLVRLRDLSAHEKHEKQKLLKEFEEKNAENEHIIKLNEKLKTRINEMEEQMEELHGYVDAALGAEEMAETLGQQKLTLEEKVKELEEAVLELEELQEVNDQLQEGFKEQEQDFRQELDMKNLQVWEAQRKTESVLESLADRELIIVKFRELVQKMQEDNQELRSQLEVSSKSSSLASSLVPEMLDFKKMFAETKAHARAIDLELQRMEITQAQQHVRYLTSFMPDSFSTRGGDCDAVMLILLMPRLLAKCQVLISQLGDKFPAVADVNKSNVTAAQQFAAMSRFCTHIHLLQGILHQFIHSLNTCKPETLLKAGASYPDMAEQEKALNAYVEMLKKERMDENLSTDSLEKIVTYFNTVHPTLLLASGDCTIHQGQLLEDLGKSLLCAIDSAQADMNIIKALLPEGEGIESLTKIQPALEGLRLQVRQVRRRANIKDLLLGPNSDLAGITKPIIMVSNILAGVAGRLIVMPADADNPIPNSKLAELLKQSFDKHYDIIGDRDRNAINFIESSIESLVSNVGNIVKNLQDNDDKYLSVKEEKGNDEPPLVVRARKVKEELNQMATVRRKLESKEEDLREMKLTLRAKQEELAEMVLRKDIAEKKMKDLELTVETLKRKLEEAYNQAKRKEKEHEAAMDHLQRDIDSLELEKGELKDRLKNPHKKTAVEIMSSSTTSLTSEISQSMINSSVSGGGPVKVVESALLINEVKHLKSLVTQERKGRMSEQTKKYLNLLNSLAPIHVPKKVPDNDMKRLDELQKKLKQLEKEYWDNLYVPTDLSDVKFEHWSSAINSHITKFELKRNEIKERTIALHNDVLDEMIRQKKGGHIATDLRLFPSPEMVKAAQNSEWVEMCEITLPTTDADLAGKVVPLKVDIPTFNQIRTKLYNLANPA
ncbi:dynactin [Nesidiocoris tenuis]|uniref:Dynactin subunit 1 n=1 Tax=Nesidiocoris tenuis TaxID=355587 RepID=A0ABN7AE95_9HEMI|nr:dynactin [Nesidiocoris tenuis]